MSAWLLALGLSAGYLMQKNQQVQSQLQQSIKEFNTREAAAAKYLTTEAIRGVQANLPDADKYQDMNIKDLPREDVNKLTEQHASSRVEVQNYESLSAPQQKIQGVYFHAERGF